MWFVRADYGFHVACLSLHTKIQSLGYQGRNRRGLTFNFLLNSRMSFTNTSSWPAAIQILSARIPDHQSGGARRGVLYESGFAPPRKAWDHWCRARESKTSFQAFSLKAAAVPSKVTQGESKTTFLKFPVGVMRSTSGWGSEMCDNRAKARLAPAESPARMICRSLAPLSVHGIKHDWPFREGVAWY